MKRLWILMAATVVLGALALVAWWPRIFAEADPARRDTRAESAQGLPAVDRSRVAAIEVSDAQHKVRVTRSGDRWVMPDRFDAPVAERQPKQILDAMDGLERSELVARSKERHHAFLLAEGEGKNLKLEDGEGRVLVSLVVGKQDTSRGIQPGTYVREEGKDAVYLHSQRLAGSLLSDPKHWMEKKLTDVEPARANDLIKEASRIVVEYDDVPMGPVTGTEPPPEERDPSQPPERIRLVLEAKEVPKDEAAAIGPVSPDKRPAPGQDPDAKTERQWTLVEPEVDPPIDTYLPFVDNMVRMLLLGTMDDVAGRDPENPDYGLDRPVMDVQVAWKDGTVRRLKIGKEVPGGGEGQAAIKYRYAHLVGSPWVVTMAEYALTHWKKKPAELKSPTPAAGTTGTPPIAIPDRDGGDR